MELSDRYLVHHNLENIGIKGQVKLSKANIAVVGLGGLGCNIAQGLASLGIGHITLIDDDIITVSNLARQILYQENDINSFKCEIAAARLRKHNSDIKITTNCNRLTQSNASSILAHQDVVIDGTDNIAARIAIDTYCAASNIPFIYGGVQKFSGQISVFNYKGGKSMQEYFPALEELLKDENCVDSGVILPVVSTVANIQVIQALYIVLDKEPVLQGVLQIIDMKNINFRKFKLF